MMLTRPVFAVTTRTLCTAGALAVMTSAAAEAPASDALTFDSDFLSVGRESGAPEKHIDLSYFAHKGGMAPGEYAVKVRVNGRVVDEGRRVTFKSRMDQPGKLYACVSPEELLDWWGIRASRTGDAVPDSGVATENAPAEADNSGAATEGDGRHEKTEKVDAGHCPAGGIMSMVPYSQETFDFSHHLLSLTVPQASLGMASRLRTPPQMWNSGMPAILMNYTYTGSQQSSRGQKSGSDFLGVNGQLNLLGWRFRSDLSGHRRQGEAAEWSLSRGYAQRSYSHFGGGQLTAGQTSSSGGGVDSVSFVGVRVDSDSGMLDPALTAYTPAITGLASSPATVTARQHGKVIFQQNVPQGPFSLTDFNRNGSGDVDVEIREAGGRVRHFILAQASNGVLMRRGALSYSASAGKASDSRGYVDNRFVQFGGSYGAWANTTLTGGALLSRDYQSVAAGTGFYAGSLGAFTYTLRTSRANLSAVPGSQGTVTGMAHDFSWKRSFGETAVGISYSRGQTPDARSYSQMLAMRPRRPDETDGQAGGTRDSLGISLSQSLGQWGSISLNGTRSTTWGSRQVQQNATLGYSTTVKGIGVAVTFGISTTAGCDREDDRWSGASGGNGKTDRTAVLTVSLPLGKWLGTDRVSSSTYSYTRTSGHVSQQTGLSGSSMNGALSYSVSQALTDTRAGNVSAGYGGHYGTVNAGYSYGGGSDSLSYGVNGGLALHSHGVTLGKPLSLDGGNALVSIPGVSGIEVGNTTTDWHGYALIGGLTPYERDRVSVNMASLPGNIELDTSSRNVVPTRGALVPVPFKSNRGFRLLLNLLHLRKPVPFGADVTLARDDDGLPVTGIVGDDGQAYLSGMPVKGKVRVRWGDAPEEQCQATYSLPVTADMMRLNTATATCR